MENIVLFVIAYLLGSIPSGVWIGKLFFHKDIRKFGSGNSGTTNTFRVLGSKVVVSLTLIVYILHFFPFIQMKYSHRKKNASKKILTIYCQCFSLQLCCYLILAPGGKLQILTCQSSVKIV